MPEVETLHTAATATHLNVTARLTAVAQSNPDLLAVACPRTWWANYQATPVRKGIRLAHGLAEPQTRRSGTVYETITFAELDADVTRIASGLAAWGVPFGTRLALLVRPGIDFVALVFGLLRAGMVIVLIDPGLGLQHLIRCLEESEVEGFIAVREAHIARLILRHKFPKVRWNVDVGSRLFRSGLGLNELRSLGDSATQPLVTGPSTRADDPAAIIFTSGSTGPPKGVLYTHRMFDTQVSEIQSAYDLHGGADLACFPLFALFNAAMGVATILPKMNFARPAKANPNRLLDAASDWQVTQAFASPAVWRVLADYCKFWEIPIPSLRQILSCGAPVPASLLRSALENVAPNAKMHTPYGATECLPVSTIEAAEVLGETAARTDAGAGVCVGRKFDSIDWRVIRITDETIASIDDVQDLPAGEIGELIVRGPQVSPKYVTRVEANALSKISDRSSVECGVGSGECGSNSPLPTPHSTLSPWHRTGDVGYFDDQQRFWYCGRKSQRVETAAGPLYTECVEGIFNTHSVVRRCALVGIGAQGQQTPVLVVELSDRMGNSNWKPELQRVARAHELTKNIEHLLVHPGLPVDVRHNAKINREKLAEWAAKRLAHKLPLTPDL